MNTQAAFPLSSPSCARHPDAAATASCRRCGDYVCSSCLAADGLCSGCDERLTVLPWSRRDELGFFPALFGTLKLSAIEPRRYGRAVAQAAGMPSALLFGTLCASVNLVLTMLIASPLMFFVMKLVEAQNKGTTPPPAWVIPLALGIMSIMGLVMFVIGSYFWALVLRVTTAVSALSLSVMQLWRIVLYASGPLVVAWVPLAGLFAPAYGVVLTILGVHEATASKSLLRSSLAVLVPVAIFLLVVGGGYLVFLYYAVTQAQHAAG